MMYAYISFISSTFKFLKAISLLHNLSQCVRFPVISSTLKMLCCYVIQFFQTLLVELANAAIFFNKIQGHG